MSIITESPTELVKAGFNYVTLPPQVLEQLTDPVSAAIWIYLQSQAERWVIRRTDIMRRWGIGRKRYDKAMHELKAAGLVWLEMDRDAGGKIMGKKLVCSNVPNLYEAEKYITRQTQSVPVVQLGERQCLSADDSHQVVPYPQDGENHLMVKTTSRERRPLNKVLINNKVSITNKTLSHINPAKNESKTSIDLTWQPAPDLIRDICYSCNVDELFVYEAATAFAGRFNGQQVENIGGELQRWVIREKGFKTAKQGA